MITLRTGIDEIDLVTNGFRIRNFCFFRAWKMERGFFDFDLVLRGVAR